MGCFLIRAEEEEEFYSRQKAIFRRIILIVLAITFASGVVGLYLLGQILKYVSVITDQILEMAQKQRPAMIDLKKASNDDVTFLGIAFNSLSYTVDNLISIFRKFANQDVVIKAYRDREIRLEGEQKELTILFSDIKKFTFITETLGSDIIKLLNIHYDRAIHEIIEHNGVIGAIIGDALLSVYGAIEKEKKGDMNKSLEAILSAYKVQDVTYSLRKEMEEKKNEIEAKSGRLTSEETKIYKAVLLEVGVGIDGGNVFYGTIGSNLRMTNTVIGDNVNAASRLEGLTRIYKLPVIVSEYVKQDVEKNAPEAGIRFVEIDKVQVKGKTIGKKIYWPILNKDWDKKMERNVVHFEEGLENYYKGDWEKAFQSFSQCKISLAAEFCNRTKNNFAPKNWNGIWEMKTK